MIGIIVIYERPKIPLKNANNRAVLNQTNPSYVNSSAADEMACLPATAKGDKADPNCSKTICDKAYTHLKELMDEIREAGKYVFRNDKNKRIILQISPAFILNITLDLQMNS